VPDEPSKVLLPPHEVLGREFDDVLSPEPVKVLLPPQALGRTLDAALSSNDCPLSEIFFVTAGSEERHEVTF